MYFLLHISLARKLLTSAKLGEFGTKRYIFETTVSLRTKFYVSSIIWVISAAPHPKRNP